MFKLSAKLRATQFAFVKPNVAADRYKKDIHEKDSARSGSHYVKSALGGAVIGALTRGKMARRQAAAIGAGVGIGAQTVARTGTGFTKDQFGDRSFTGKSIDKAVPTAGLIGAGVLAIRKLRGRMPVTLAARGTTKRQLLSAKLKEVHFFAKSYEHHSDREARDTTGQFRDSLGAAIRGETNYRNETVGLTDAPVINNAYRRAKTAVKIGNRVGALSRDAAGALAGQAKVDNRGRPLKREWEKSWFTNGIKNVVATGAVLGGAALLRKNPKLRGALVAAGARAAGRAGTVVKRGAQAVGTGINKATNVDRFFAAKVRAYFFDATASDWDVRDARGRSARVFAPGARPRERREKQWHEKVGNIRRVAVIGALTAAAGGAGLGYKLGKRLSKATPAPAAVIAEPPLKLIKFPQFAVTPPRAS